MSQHVATFRNTARSWLTVFLAKENYHQETDNSPEVDVRADWTRYIFVGANPTCDNLTHVSIRYEELLKPLPEGLIVLFRGITRN